MSKAAEKFLYYFRIEHWHPRNPQENGGWRGRTQPAERMTEKEAAAHAKKLLAESRRHGYFDGLVTFDQEIDGKLKYRIKARKVIEYEDTYFE
jgi:hypothetical protein